MKICHKIHLSSRCDTDMRNIFTSRCAIWSLAFNNLHFNDTYPFYVERILVICLDDGSRASASARAATMEISRLPRRGQLMPRGHPLFTRAERGQRPAKGNPPHTTKGSKVPLPPQRFSNIFHVRSFHKKTTIPIRQVVDNLTMILHRGHILRHLQSDNGESHTAYLKYVLKQAYLPLVAALLHGLSHVSLVMYRW